MQRPGSRVGVKGVVQRPSGGSGDGTGYLQPSEHKRAALTRKAKSPHGINQISMTAAYSSYQTSTSL